MRGHKEPGSKNTYLVPYVLLKILLTRNIQANTTLPKRLSLDLVVCAGNGRNHDIGGRQALFEGKLAGVCDVMSVEPAFRGDARCRPFGIFLQIGSGIQSMAGGLK